MLGRLLRQRLQHRHLGVGHDHGRLGAADAGRRARRSPTGATTTRSRTTRSGACCCWSADITTVTGVTGAGQRLVGVGREPAALERDDAAGRQAAAARQPHDGVQPAARDDLPVRRHGPRRHRRYGPSEFWEYLPEHGGAAERRRLHARDGGELRVGQLRRRRLLRADRRPVQRHLQVVQRRRQAGDLLNVPAGLPDDTCPSDQACDADATVQEAAGAGLQPVQRVRERQLRRRRLLRHRLQRQVQAVQPGQQARHLLVRAVGRGRSGGRRPPACPSRTRAASVRRRRQLHQHGEGRPASRARRAASARAGFCIDGYCCNSGCAQTCYQCDKAGALGTLLGRWPPAQQDHERDHAVRRSRCSTATAPGRA